jgi:hypothetical protein
LREQHRPKCFENRVLRKVSGPNRDEVTGSGEDYITMSFMVSTPQQTILGDQIKKNKMDGVCSKYGREERCMQVFGGKSEGKGSLGRPDADGRAILKCTSKIWDMDAWTGLIWLGIRTGGGLDVVMNIQLL